MVPFNNTYNGNGMIITNQMISWCEENGIDYGNRSLEDNVLFDLKKDNFQYSDRLIMTPYNGSPDHRVMAYMDYFVKVEVLTRDKNKFNKIDKVRFWCYKSRGMASYQFEHGMNELHKTTPFQEIVKMYYKGEIYCPNTSKTY